MNRIEKKVASQAQVSERDFESVKLTGRLAKDIPDELEELRAAVKLTPVELECARLAGLTAREFLKAKSR
jgi:hypothetical protein